MVFSIWRRFLDGMPVYLARRYWWAYLWRVGAWFFDHQPVINAILFGQYKKLMRATLARLGCERTGRMLQVTCVYGSLTPALIRKFDRRPLHIMDIAPVQLKLVQSKCKQPGCLLPTRMNAERLAYQSGVFDTVIIFFLLHEMPPEARHRVIAEAVRILAPNGRLIVTEYAPLPTRHVLYRFPPFRWLLTRLEPFLDGFWREDMTQLVQTTAQTEGKTIYRTWSCDFFYHFYRITEFRK